MATTDTQGRLEYLRGELRAERISYGELLELQSMADEIPAGDVELLEAAGVPEHPPRFTFLPVEVARLTGQAFHRGPDGEAIYGLTEEPEGCGGTGCHECQPVSSCDECDPEAGLE